MRVGIDIGGTNTRVALVEQNKIKNLEMFETNQDFKKAYQNIKNVIKNWEEKFEIELIAIGLPCPIRKNNTKIGVINNLKKWQGIDLIEEFQKDFKQKITLNNDANLATLGQAVVKRKQNLLFFTISTGIGGGIIINNKIYEGFTGTAGEVSNCIPEINKPENDTIPSGLEFWASGTNIVKKLNEMGVDVKDTKTAFAKYKQKDPSVIEFFEKIENKFISFFTTMIYFFNPEIIVLGGSVAEHNEWFFKDIIKRTINITKEIGYETEIEFAENMTESTLIGAVNTI